MDKVVDKARYTDTHVYFWEGYFSNFHVIKGGITYKGHWVATSEHAFMLEKALLFGDTKQVENIVNASHPYEAKRAGREVENYDDEKWEDYREEAMYKVLIEKFSKDYLKKRLLDTGDRVLVEASPYDKIWGVGLNVTDDKILDESNWTGQNLLGIVLMKVRDYYKSQL